MGVQVGPRKTGALNRILVGRISREFPPTGGGPGKFDPSECDLTLLNFPTRPHGPPRKAGLFICRAEPPLSTDQTEPA